MRVLPHSIATGVLVVVISGAAAAQQPGTPDRSVTVRGVTFNGSGCRPGDAIESLDDSRSRATVIFSANTAASGQGIAAADSNKACEVAMTLGVRGDEPESKVLLILRGHAALPPGASGRVESRWSWSGGGPGPEQQNVLRGGESGTDDNFTLTRELVLDTSSKSDRSPLTVETRIAMLDGREAFVTIDSLDVAIGPSPFEGSFAPPDATPPEITAIPSEAPSASGWFPGDVTVAFSCTDPESPIVPQLSDLEPKVLQATGDAAGKCVNVTGSSSSTTYHARIDASAPRVFAGLYPGLGLVARGTRLPSAYACIDGDSGIAGCGGPSWLDTSVTGLHTFSVKATDRAGHETTMPMSYRVGDAADCADDGWRNFSTPMFRDENECLTALQPPTTTTKGSLR